ncbi:MAG TPA: NAD(P)-dependent oxidoreductase [Euryarchaeota archaeon]|nr:MAG: NAD(P)-dependent oxidoreductase [Thermoplasmata archaeon]HDD59525.1 NAD(P)-dependent oxidoreductase [Euryarchaeota archaeon]
MEEFKMSEKKTPPKPLPVKDRFKRVPIKMRSPEERIHDFDLYIHGYTDEEARAEAARCLACNVCVKGCPARLDIGAYVRAIADGEPKNALQIILKDLPLPTICGYVCTHNCEDLCVLGRRGDPIAIRHLKRYAAEAVEDYSEVVEATPEPDTGKKVAIIGAGPAGLTLAYRLALKGVKPVIFDALPYPGGTMYVGIPPYRLPRKVIEKEVEFIKSFGVEFRFNTRVGEDIPFEKLMEEYDAVFIGVGNHRPRRVECKGSDCSGVYHALEFLRGVALGEIKEVGRRVAVIGGGFTAMDAARVSLRLGAEKVMVLYRRRAQDRPGYPSSNAEEELREAEEEGIEFIWTVTPFEYTSKDGHISGIKYWKNRMIEVPGKRAKPEPIKDQEYFVEVDTVIEATGQKIDFDFIPEEIREKLEMSWSEIKVNEFGETSIPGVFAGGDATNEKKDIISAVADGNRAAVGILRYLFPERAEEFHIKE